MTKQEYQKLLLDPRWTDKRNEILFRDMHMCQQCMNGFNLQVHHKRYREGLKPWEYHNYDLVTLCNKCHTVEHGLEGDSEDFWVIKGRVIASAVRGILCLKEAEFQKEKQNG